MGGTWCRSATFEMQVRSLELQSDSLALDLTRSLDSSRAESFSFATWRLLHMAADCDRSGARAMGNWAKKENRKKCNGMTVRAQMSALKAPGPTTIKHDVKFNSHWD